MSGSNQADVLVLDTGVANIASMLSALEGLGAKPELTRDASRVLEAPRLVLPGVGAFGAGATRLDDLALREPIIERIRADRHPTLCVCLGLQLLCDSSDESPGHEGLGVVGAHVGRFGSHVRVPQLGWNEVAPEGDSLRVLTEPGFAYFANSFRVAEMPEGWEGATADYGGRFVAALERGNLVACQFHPEISGTWGHRVLARWLEL